jgi:hypothetical protein
MSAKRGVCDGSAVRRADRVAVTIFIVGYAQPGAIRKIDKPELVIIIIKHRVTGIRGDRREVGIASEVIMPRT